MNSTQKIQDLLAELEKLYLKNSQKLLYHGWHHVSFVTKKATEFASSIGANSFLVETAAMCHDLNYIVAPDSEPEAGNQLRKKYLAKAGYLKKEAKRIEEIIVESHLRTRTKKISKEGKALSDADSLFKALPITPILFATNYITQNKIDIHKLARKVSSEQNQLMRDGIYFYTKLAKKKYLKWAKINLALWDNANEALEDKDVLVMIEVAKELKVL